MGILGIVDGGMRCAQQGLCALTSRRLQTAVGGELMVSICPWAEVVRLWDSWEGVRNIVWRSRFLLRAWERQRLLYPVCAACCRQRYRKICKREETCQGWAVRGFAPAGTPAAETPVLRGCLCALEGRILPLEACMAFINTGLKADSQQTKALGDVLFAASIPCAAPSAAARTRNRVFWAQTPQWCGAAARLTGGLRNAVNGVWQTPAHVAACHLQSGMQQRFTEGLVNKFTPVRKKRSVKLLKAAFSLPRPVFID